MALRLGHIIIGSKTRRAYAVVSGVRCCVHEAERPVNVLHCQNLTKRYGSIPAIDQLTLELNTGEPIALIGPNGAGKTTLISLICGFIQPSEGQITILGHKPGSAALSGQLAALPQDALLDPRLNVGRQLRFFARLQGLNQREGQYGSRPRSRYC